MKYISVSLALLLCTGITVTKVHAASPWAAVLTTTDEQSLHLVHEGHAGAAQASGVVNTVDATQRKVNVSHGSIKQLGWPAMTMDFPVSGDVDLASVKPGMTVNFTLVKASTGAWTVDTLKPATKK